MMSWNFVQNNTGTLLIGRYIEHIKLPKGHESPQIPKKIASFDLDSTLITTSSGSLHALSPTDWKWWHPSVPQKLRSLVVYDYTLIIFSNQGRLTTSSGSEAPECDLFKQKIEAICQELGVDFTIYVACANDIYRKPRIGMWDVMCEDFGIGQSISSNEGGDAQRTWKQIPEEKGEIEAYLVGDAAGRKCDHSDADSHFCENLGITHFTPEEFFLGEKTTDLGHKFDPKWYLPATLGGTLNYEAKFKIPTKPELIELVLLVGLPGAGKTTYYRRLLQPLGYKRVNELEFGNLDDCLIIAHQLLSEGTSIVIDEINATSSLRKPWLSLAQKHNIKTRALNFTTTVDLCLHNDSVRVLGGLPTNPEIRPITARMDFRKVQQVFQKPRVEEGFEDVLDVEFEWRGSEEQMDVWRRHWL